MVYLEREVQARVADEFFGEDPEQVTDILRNIEQRSQRHGFANYIDSEDLDYDQLIDIGIVLPEAVPDSIAEYLGKDAVLWAAANARNLEQSKALDAKSAELFGVSPKSIHRAIMASKNHSRSIISADILIAQTRLAAFNNKITTLLDIPKHIQSHAADGVAVSPQRAEQYDLVPVEPDSLGSDGFIRRHWPSPDKVTYGMYLDGPFGLVLTYKNNPIAVTSYSLTDPDVVSIYEVQGVTGRHPDTGNKVSPRGLAPLDWQGMFIDTAAAAARHAGASYLQIWCKSPCTSNPDAIRKHYAEPAARNGFTTDDNRIWRRPVDATLATSASASETARCSCP